MCERVLEEKDQVLSVIRIVDIYYIQPVPPDLPPTAQPVVQVTALLGFKKSLAEKTSVKHTVSLLLHGPSGRPVKLVGHDSPELKTSFAFEADKSAANVVVNAALPPKEFGRYWYDVVLDGELVTQIPFTLLERQPERETQKQ